MMRMPTILLSPVGGRAISGIIDYFQKKGFHTVGMDVNPESVGRFFVDEFCNVPPVGSSSYLDTVSGIIRDYHVDTFISWLDQEIIVWNQLHMKGGIPADIHPVLAVNLRRDIMNFYDKYALYTLLSSNGFLSPGTRLISDCVSWSETSYPAIIKPRTGSGSKGTFIVSRCEELYAALASIKEESCNLDGYLIQQFIPGPEYTVDFFADAGKIINSVSRRRIEHEGVSLRGEIVFDSDIEDIIARFCRAFEINGLNNIQLIRNNGDLYITDVNLRPSGTISFSVHAGVDLFQNVMEWKNQSTLTRFGKPRPLKMIRYLTEHYYYDDESDLL